MLSNGKVGRSLSQDIKATYFLSFHCICAAGYQCVLTLPKQHPGTDKASAKRRTCLVPMLSGSAEPISTCHAQKHTTKLICTSVEILQSFPSCHISALGYRIRGEWQLFILLALLWIGYLFECSLHLAFLFVPLVWVIALIWISRLTPYLTLFCSLLYCVLHPAFLLSVLIKNYRGLMSHFYVKFISKNNMHARMFMYHRI